MPVLPAVTLAAVMVIPAPLAPNSVTLIPRPVRPITAPVAVIAMRPAPLTLNASIPYSPVTEPAATVTPDPPNWSTARIPRPVTLVTSPLTEIETAPPPVLLALIA